MKIALTGHTKRFGKHIKKYLEDKGHTVIGFSRSNGYNINYDYKKIALESAECDMFINNTNSYDGQARILIEYYNLYKDTDKTIVCIGTEITKYPNTKHLHEYLNKKSLLDMVNLFKDKGLNIKYLSWGYWKCDITNDHPELLDPTTMEEALNEILDTNS